jgi:hypothetical protein
MMNKLLIALIATAFAGTAAAQTGTVSPATVADHGTPALHAAESAKNTETSKAVKGLPDTKARQQAVKDTTKVADHGTPVIHANELQKNVTASQGTAKQIASDKAGQDALKTATKGATK